MRIRTPVAAVMLLALLTACGGVLESRKPARQHYLLQPPTPPAGENTGAVLVLSVSAVPGLDTDRILVLGRDARLNPVAGAHWADHLPEVFTSITRRALSDSGRFERVATGTIARPDEWRLDVELQAFYGIEGAADLTERVMLRLEAALRCGDVRERIVIEETTPARGDRVGSLVAAHQDVLDAALEGLPGRVGDLCGAG